MSTKKLPLGLYVHYPWCVRKCPYCDFNSYKKIKDVNCDEAYVDCLIRDFEDSLEYIDDRKLLSIYFGGGTPSLLNASLMQKLLKRVEPYINSNTEISMECNPGTVVLDSLKAYKDIGINRLSIGVQSFSDESLKLLGRIHDAKTAITTCENVTKAGFDNFNIDIMHGLPSQNVDMALNDLKKAVDLGANHLSWYELTIEEDTYFGYHPPVLPTEDTLALIEELGFDLLNKSGFNRYEVSGFTKNKRCLHNENYWLFGDYLGIGAGAHSKIKLGDKTYRRAHAQSVNEYKDNVYSKNVSFNEVKTSDLPFEFMLNRLRIFDKVKLDEFTNTTNLPFEIVKDKLEEASRKNLISFVDDYFYVTDFGKIMLNDILELFL